MANSLVSYKTITRRIVTTSVHAPLALLVTVYLSNQKKYMAQNIKIIPFFGRKPQQESLYQSTMSTLKILQMKTEHVTTTVNTTQIPIVCFWKSGTTVEKMKKKDQNKNNLKIEHSKFNIFNSEKSYLEFVCIQTNCYRSLLSRNKDTNVQKQSTSTLYQKQVHSVKFSPKQYNIQ